MILLESEHLVRFPDCDPFNHLNNARYLDYFLNAREDQEMQQLGFNTYAYTERTGNSWVVSQNQVAYFSPAVLMEKVIIQSYIREWNSSDILYEMRMWPENKQKLKALLWTRFVHYDLKHLKRTDHPPELKQHFLDNILPENAALSFEERVVTINKSAYHEA